MTSSRQDQYKVNPYFYSDNDWGIPQLDGEFQLTEISLPFEPWGARARKLYSGGTKHFYIDDYKIEPLWNDPNKLTRLPQQMIGVIEPNFTIAPETPRSLALYQIYRKRYLSRFWQNYGINIMVDVFVPEEFFDIALLGVPEGWSSYALRGHPSWSEKDYMKRWKLCASVSGSEFFIFLVYAGGKKTQQIAKDNGWFWFPQYDFSGRS